MRLKPCLILVLLALWGCQSRENIDEVEAGAAAAASTENQVMTYARRVQRAEAKLEDYDRLASGIESRLKTKRSEVKELRAEVGRRAQELQALKKESQSLDTELKAQKDKLGALQGAMESEKALVMGAEAELRSLEEERRSWVIKLEEARTLHLELKDVVVPLLARLPSLEPDMVPDEEPESDESQVENETPASQPSGQKEAN